MTTLVKQSDDVIAARGSDLGHIVADLNGQRAASEHSGRRYGPRPLLPSREAVIGIIDGLVAALFPRHFGPPGLTDEGADGFVGYAVDAALQSLEEQARRELQLESEEADKGAADQAQRASEIRNGFAAALPKVRTLLESDIRAAFEGDPAAKSLDEVVFCYPGVTAIIRHRVAHELYLLGAPLLARIVSEIAHSETGIDIHPGAEIGESFFIDHGTGVVIGETSIIGRHVRLYQAVTLGAKRFEVDEHGALIKNYARHPIVEDDVVIYAGATILGRITIGRGSAIGGNVWLTQSVPPGSNITQAKLRSEAFDEGGGI
ncbi:serine O-acetyltransferase EpsC [Methylocapsa aurea]|uniref:serine O-acetyltransferase EpsC n=1 Tax=Methylocapsa aurea TaxID=663610 RepID=UPI00055ED95F|nr:serine O-acetyltransferase EpsC [Methylocapsa aurea]